MRWTTAAATMVAMLTSAGRVQAAPVTFSGAPAHQIELHSGSFARWIVSNTAGTAEGLPTGTCADDLPGLAVYDAVFDPGGVGKGDAFDHAFALWVDNALFVAPDAVDLTDDTLTAGPVNLSGLEVTMEYRAIPSSATLRALATFHNPTGAFIAARVILATNFGSDSATAERGSGSEGAWRVTSDSATSPSDPPLLLVRGGSAHGLAQSYVPITDYDDTTFPCYSGNPQGQQLTGDLVVAPGQTIALLQFVRMAATNEAAIAAGAAFETNPPLDSDLMAGITAEQSRGIVNWSFLGAFEITGGGARWTIDGTNATSNGRATGGTCTAMPAIGIADARVGAPERGDAFDGGLVLFVGDRQIPNTATVTQIDQTVTVGPTTVSGLDVTLRYTALQGSPTLRTLAILHNPTAATVTTSVHMATNVGSDNKTIVQATSSGDTTIDAGDTLVITSDDPLTLPTPDAVNTHVVAGPGTPRTVPTVSDRVFDCADSKAPNGVLATFALTLGPGETRALLFFNQVHTTVEQATDTASDFVFLNDSRQDDPLFAGIDAPTLSQVVNWALCDGANYFEVRCRLAGLSADASGSGAAGPVLDKLLARLGAATTAIDKATTNATTTRKAARTKRLNKAAMASLKAFEKMLQSKKSQAVFGDAVRTRLTTVSGEIRATIKTLPLVILRAM